MAGLEILGVIGSIGGSLLSAAGAKSQADAKARELEAEAAWRERQAGEERAASQRNAAQKGKQADLVMSRQQAVAAASGGSATDVTVLDLMERTAGEGELQKQTVLYQGTEKAAGLTYQAAIKRAAADDARRAGSIAAGASLLSGLTSFGKFRKGFYGGSSMPSYSDY